MHFIHHHIITIAVAAAVAAVVVVAIHKQQQPGQPGPGSQQVNMRLTAHPIVIVGR